MDSGFRRNDELRSSAARNTHTESNRLAAGETKLCTSTNEKIKMDSGFRRNDELRKTWRNAHAESNRPAAIERKESAIKAVPGHFSIL